jgi:hypothetical protein
MTMNSTTKFSGELLELIDAACLVMRIWSVVIGIAGLAFVFLTLAR